MPSWGSGRYSHPNLCCRWGYGWLMDLVGELGTLGLSRERTHEEVEGKCKYHGTNFVWRTCFIWSSIHLDPAPGIRSRSFGAGRQPVKCRLLHIDDRKVMQKLLLRASISLLLQMMMTTSAMMASECYGKR